MHLYDAKHYVKVIINATLENETRTQTEERMDGRTDECVTRSLLELVITARNILYCYILSSAIHLPVAMTLKNLINFWPQHSLEMQIEM